MLRRHVRDCASHIKSSLAYVSQVTSVCDHAPVKHFFVTIDTQLCEGRIPHNLLSLIFFVDFFSLDRLVGWDQSRGGECRGGYSHPGNPRGYRLCHIVTPGFPSCLSLLRSIQAYTVVLPTLV
jgi:hypothetical protein